MVDIESGDVMLMRDESFTELLDEINAKSQQARLAVVLCWVGIVAGTIAGLVTSGAGIVVGAIALPLWAVGAWFDSYRRSSVLFYDLEGDAETAYTKLAQGFDAMRSCAGKWHVEAGGTITNLTAWKRNAGASHLVEKKSTTLAYSLPSVIKSNLTPPALNVGKQVMYFFPDVVLMQEGSRIGAITYRDLEIRWQDSRFIEDGPVPSDARIVDHTWKHPNKSGGPDRRFKDNKQIPICLYEVIHFRSDSGVNELLEFSRTGNAAVFGAACELLARLPRERKAIAEQPVFPPPDVASSPSVVQRRRRSPVLLTLFGIVVFTGLLVLGTSILGSRHSATTNSDNAVAAPVSENLTSMAPSLQLSGEATKSGIAIATEPPQLGTGIPVTVQTADSAAASKSASTPALASMTRYGVNLREGPGKTYRVLTTLKKETAVTQLETSGSWTKIRVDEQTTGWLITDAIR
ncbi:SH3 domain-containing protein [Rhizobium sp. NPDC090275]|uniref:SH3 domain-containing protein n=1 Tax=Rhizobium sp. NPDC090275 TaxID=3364498 RepID=UPI00383A576A